MLDGIVREAATQFGDRPVLISDGNRVLSYAELDRQSDLYGLMLRSCGLGEGSVVALRIPSGPEYLIAYAAAAKIGAISAGLNPSLTNAEHDALLEGLQPDHVIDSTNQPAATGEFAGSDEPSAGRLLALDEDPERTIAIVYTSGTTGPPKGAVFRNRQLEAICDIDLGAGWRERWGGGGPMLSSTQFAHVGFMTKLPWYLRLGVTMHALDRWRAADVLQTIATERISTLGVVAPQLALILRCPEVDELDLSCVTKIIAGGAASPPSLVAAAHRTFDAVYSIRYSSTESGGVGLTTADDASEHEALFTIGRPRPGIEVRVVDEQGGDTGPDIVGELILRSPTMFDYYWNNPEATAATLRDGWLHTGDLAAIDRSGLTTLHGRSKEMYIRGGYNVAPAEVETVLCQHPNIEAIAIAPRSDSIMGEVGIAVVVPRKGCEAPSLEELRRAGSESLAKWKLPEGIIVVDELPLTSMTKIDRGALANLVRSTYGDDTVEETAENTRGTP